MAGKTLQSKPEYALNETRPEGAGNADEPLDITRTTEVRAMPVEATISPKGDSANQFTQPTGTTPWKAAVIRDLREGFGVEDIAHRMGCDVQAVRDLVADLRRHGLLPRLYMDARAKWRASA